MNRLSVRAIAPVLNEAALRSGELIDMVVRQTNIDPATGRVTILNVTAITDAFRTILGPGSETYAESFLALLQDGYAVTAGAGDTFDLPWRALSHAPSLAAMTTEGWNQLGIRPWSRIDSSRLALRRQFPLIPDYVLEDERLGDLIEWAARRDWLDRANPVMIMGAGGGGREPNPDPTDTPPPDGNVSPPSVSPGVIKRVVELASKAADCLVNGQWSIERVGWFPVGPKVCLDADCTEKVEQALWADAGATILAILTAGSFTAPAVLAAAGGWAGLAMLHFSLHWAALMSLNKTPNGVCLVHFFPWISPAFGGILNGYAVGR